MAIATASLASPPGSGGTDQPVRSSPELARVRAYYDETWSDYRRAWLSPKNCAIHFGYWDDDTSSHAESLLHMNRALARQLDIQQGQRVFDAGCGVGGSAIWLAKTYGVEVVGITPVASQVSRARRFAAMHGVADQVTFELGDYTDAPEPDGRFDVVWAIESVCHAPDKRRFLAEARRLLGPGGRLGMVEYVRTRRPFPPVDEALLHSWLSGWAIPDLATPGEWREWARAEGFVGIRLRDITPRVRPSLRRLYWMATAAWPVASAVRALGLRTATRHGNTRGARDQYRALGRGLWREHLLTSVAPNEKRPRRAGGSSGA